MRTDPLSRDFDADSIPDGRERILGIEVAGTSSDRTVFSNPNTGDSDFDGLPDYVERALGTDPTSADTDGDGPRDYDEVSQKTFDRFAGLSAVYSGFSLDGSGSQLLGTSPTKVDKDGDGLADLAELTGYVIKVVGQGATKRVLTDPLDPDTDDDFLNDEQESVLKTDATVPDSDGDGRVDGVECCPVTSDGVTATAACNPATTAACEAGQVRSSDNVTVAGSNSLMPELRVTVIYARLISTWGGLGGEGWWNFYVHKSDENFPGVRGSDPAAAAPNGGCPTIAEDNGFDSECNWSSGRCGRTAIELRSLPFRRLHSVQDRARFSSVVFPPCFSAMTWSTWCSEATKPW